MCSCCRNASHFCRATTCHGPACFSMAPGEPRLGPGFQNKILKRVSSNSTSLAVLPKWEHDCVAKNVFQTSMKTKQPHCLGPSCDSGALMPGPHTSICEALVHVGAVSAEVFKEIRRALPQLQLVWRWSGSVHREHVAFSKDHALVTRQRWAYPQNQCFHTKQGPGRPRIIVRPPFCQSQAVFHGLMA